MAAWFQSGLIIDLILLAMLVEGAVLSVAGRRRGGPPPGELWSTLAAGGALLVALRLALADAAWGWIALCLAAALLGHAAYLWHRFRRAVVDKKA